MITFLAGMLCGAIATVTVIIVGVATAKFYGDNSGIEQQHQQ